MSDILPWQRTGQVKTFNRDEMSLVIDDTDKFVIRKLRPNEPKTGNFAVFHNDKRISEKYHEFMANAKAEAEAYFYSLPRFAKSGNAVALESVKRFGTEAYRTGQSVFEALKYDGAYRERWLEGWLNGFGDVVVNRLKVGIEATSRANAQLEADCQTLTARNAALIALFEFALTQPTVEKTVDALRTFLHIKNDPDAMNKAFPEWSSFLASRKAT